MRFPSVTALTERAWIVALRFPWTLAAAALAAAAACVAVDGSNDRADQWGRIAMTLMLAVPLSAGVTLAGERRGWSGVPGVALQLAGLAVLALFYAGWPGPREQWEMLRYLQLSAALHLLVAVLPFIRGSETSAFWEYNRQLFLAFLRAAVFSAVLFVGLAIALAALDKLFGVHVPSRLYGRLWVVIALLGNTWIFLAALPEDVAMREGATDYPRALKIFTQYILTPLVGVYLVMLTAYLAKIVVTREWPSGWIGWLVGSVAVSGILGFLLVDPLRRARDEGWIGIYARWLFIGLMPAAVMLLLALGKRVGPYGLTELRVIALALGVWLFTVAVVYTLRPASGIRLIPLSLAAVLAVLMAGPMSAARLSIRSQAHRLNRLLAEFGSGTPRDAKPEIRQELSGATRYLVERHATGPLERAFGVRVAPDTGRLAGRADSTAAQLLAGKSIAYLPADRSRRYPPLSRPRGVPVATAGYQWLVEMDAGDTGTVVVGGDSLHYGTDSTRTVLTLTGRGGDTLRFELGAAARAAARPTGAPTIWTAEPFVVAAESGRFRGLLALQSVYGADDGRISGWSAQLLLALR
jgi:hypothetical protein